MPIGLDNRILRYDISQLTSGIRFSHIRFSQKQNLDAIVLGDCPKQMESTLNIPDANYFSISGRDPNTDVCTMFSIMDHGLLK